MNKLAISLIALISIIMMACNTTQKHESTDGTQEPMYLILYYSQTGNTKSVAEHLAKALGADVEAIEVENPYSGTYDETIQRCIAERDSDITPAIKPVKAAIADYDVIFLGYPIWFGTYARPILGLLAQQDFEGKTIVPFCTFGSGGLEASAADLAGALPKATIAEGYGVRAARMSAMPAELNRFLIEHGYVEGAVEPLPDFAEQHPVTAEEVSIFDSACGDYQFPLGTPLTAGSRKVAQGTEYKYAVEGTNPHGEKTATTIYVVAPEGADPYFTKVVR